MCRLFRWRGAERVSAEKAAEASSRRPVCASCMALSKRCSNGCGSNGLPEGGIAKVALLVDLRGKLQPCEFRVQAILAHELRVRALRDDAAGIHDHDAVGALHGRETVCD